MVWGDANFFISSVSLLENCVLREIYPFLLNPWVYGPTFVYSIFFFFFFFVYSIFLMPCIICRIWHDSPIFISYIGILCSLFLGQLWYKFINIIKLLKSNFVLSFFLLFVFYFIDWFSFFFFFHFFFFFLFGFNIILLLFC